MTELRAKGPGLAEIGLETRFPGKGKVTESETRERRIEGEVKDKQTNWHTRTFTIENASDAERLFTVEEQ